MVVHCGVKGVEGRGRVILWSGRVFKIDRDKYCSGRLEEALLEANVVVRGGRIIRDGGEVWG
jgi:hypothetical protein